MKRLKIIVIAAVAVLGVAALGGAAVRANADAGVKSATPPASSAAANVQQGDQNGLDGAEVADKAEAGQPDTDNVEVQEGDQNGPDGTEASDKAEAGSKKAEADGPGGPNDQSGNQVEDGTADAAE